MAFVGIDLGTTNSAIASFADGKVQLYKSPEQQDVTPSVIYATARSRYVGSRAYTNAAANPENAARLFKRFMGTDTPIPIAASGETLSPVSASAEIPRTLMGYLPDDIRNDPSTGTVITVPAAFNQMQRDATSAAAEQAGLGLVALMQEPVAAVMAVMQADDSDGIFLIYDLGGGTLDIAIAESVKGRVSLLSHGGINMLGGRDFDRRIFDNVVRPWLFREFHLPVDAHKSPDFSRLFRVAEWAAEKAKIELSQRDTTNLGLAEEEVRVVDLDGKDIYLDIPLNREQLNLLIRERIRESVGAARAAIKDVGLTAHDIQRIVFVGGPTQYSPLREEVSFQLGIKGTLNVNPMTAVAQGAAIFAESIDWSAKSRGRKKTRGTIESGANLVFRFDARTPSAQARVAVVFESPILSDLQIQFDSETTGWTSGKMRLTEGEVFGLPLPAHGVHRFRVSVFGSSGSAIELPTNLIEITRTAATVDAIPASHTISIEALDKAGGGTIPVNLVRKGDHLPKIGQPLVFQAQQSVTAGSDDALIFKLYEGEIQEPIDANRQIGSLRIKGTDLTRGQIPVGAELICRYEVLDSGNVKLEVEVPSVGEVFSDDVRFYIRESGEIDFSDESTVQRLQSEQQVLDDRIDKLETRVVDPRLEEAKRKLHRIDQRELDQGDSESAKQLSEDLQEARNLIGAISQEHRSKILEMELADVVRNFEENIHELAETSEQIQFENLRHSASSSIEMGQSDTQRYIDEMRGIVFGILWRQDWFVEDWFRSMTSRPWLFNDMDEFESIQAQGETALLHGDTARLRAVVWELDRLRFAGNTAQDDPGITNIIFRHRA
jgi:molecular chaperone DnaK